MFCPSCGRENLSDARFCNCCGTALATADRPEGSVSASSSPARPLESGKRLRRLHTFDWEGECPACGSVETSETARCPIDGSPLVVALDASPRNPFALPIRSAEMRCVRDCGYHQDTVFCSRDGGIIKGKYIRFGFSAARTLLHNLARLTVLVAGLLMLAAAILTLIENKSILLGLINPDAPPPANRGPNARAIEGLVGQRLMLGLAGIFLVLFTSVNWWPFRSSFTFDDVAGKAR